MNVLLVHSEDTLPIRNTIKWDLVVDLGRAPEFVYKAWSKQAGCSVVSIFDYADGAEDLYRIRDFRQSGMDILVDRYGIDWWDVLSVMLVSDLQRYLRVEHLAKQLRADIKFYATRADSHSEMLGAITGRDVETLDNSVRVFRTGGRYWQVATNLEFSKLTQAMWDKFDSRHILRRRISVTPRLPRGPVVLLPSAYVNVSRTAVSYARLLPERSFLLVCARKNARLPLLPHNVTQISLDSYFDGSNTIANESFVQLSEKFQRILYRNSGDFHAVCRTGIIGRFADFLPWGFAIRDAWMKVFDRANVAACLSADEANPYTRIPLVLARSHSLPALSCHHGALDYNMTWKSTCADFYLAKEDMEKDYLEKVCQVSPHQTAMAGFPKEISLTAEESNNAKSWLVFFAEPFETAGWRTEEVYRELLPYLFRLAIRLESRLVVKLHPFQSAKEFRRMLKKLAPHIFDQTIILSGKPEGKIWRQIRIGITCQSSVALECKKRGIPVFLCGWLKDPYSGYQAQFAKFGVGQVIEHPELIAEIPEMLKNSNFASPEKLNGQENADIAKLKELLSGNFHASAAVVA